MPQRHGIRKDDAPIVYQVVAPNVNIRCVFSGKRDGDGRVSRNVDDYAKPLPVARAYQGLFKQMRP